MQKTINIIQVNAPKSGIGKTGKPWTMTDCECIVRGSDGVAQVGVLLLGKTIDASKVVPGDYVGTFDIAVDYKTRKIGAEIVDLQPVAAAPIARPAPAAATVKTA